MPKDPTKNVDRYKIRGGHLNEFDFTQNQAELAEPQTTRDAKLIPGTPPEEKREGLRPVVAKPQKAAKKTAKKPAKKQPAKKAAKKSATTSITKGASAKKLAARKASKKSRKATKK